MISVKISLSNNAHIPTYESEGAAGVDLYAAVSQDVIIEPGTTTLIPTGITLEIPPGYEGQIRPRSGLALKNNITLLNSPGTIDSDYRGEIKIIVTNFGTVPFMVTQGMRIAQMVFSRVYRAEFIESGILTTTERNRGGFGHTGL